MIGQPRIRSWPQGSGFLVSWTFPGDPPYFLVIAAAALITDVMILSYAGELVAAASIAAIYSLGVLFRLLYFSKTRIGVAECLGTALSTVIVIGAIVGVLSGLTFSAIVALGYLFAIGSGYSIYRLYRAETRAEAAAPLPQYSRVLSETEVKAMKNVDIFRYLSDEQVSKLTRLGLIEEMRAGEILGVQGKHGSELYIILEGQVELTAVSSMGHLTVRIAGPNESLPLAALMGDGTLITSAQAIDDGRVLVIPRSRLFELCNEHPDIGFQLFRAVAEILADRYKRTLDRFSETVDKALERSEIWANV